MGGSGIVYEMNSSYGISPQPLSENASEMAFDSVSLLKSTVGADTSFSSSFGGFATVPLENEGVKTTSHLLHDPSSLSSDIFGSGNFSEMVGSLGFVTGGHQSQIADHKCPFSYVPNLDAGGSEEEKDSLKNNTKAWLNCAYEKRRKLALGSDSSSPNENAEDNLNVEPNRIVSEILKKDDKTVNVENRMCENFNTKSEGKQAKGGSRSVQAPKENYIHVRAQQGRATNSHRLAEKVRREKIGERMKFLQELVPGCNQITGKTVVLDEIINYVQSLQQQVEFLSMKLANVGPESDLDAEKILVTNNSYISPSRILRTKGDGINSVVAIDHRITTSHTTSHAMFQRHGTIPNMSRTSQQLSSLAKMKQ